MDSEEFKWYSIQTYSGSERQVRDSIEKLKKDYRLEDRILEILVPTEDIIDFDRKTHKKKILIKSLYPGYIFIKVKLDTELWQLIQSLPRVGRFIGEAKKPTPLTDADIQIIMEKEHNRAAPRPRILFEYGELVRIIDGSWMDVTARVEEYDMERRMLKLNISMFGRNTIVDEIPDTQVEKVI